MHLFYLGFNCLVMRMGEEKEQFLGLKKREIIKTWISHFLFSKKSLDMCFACFFWATRDLNLLNIKIVKLFISISVKRVKWKKRFRASSIDKGSNTSSIGQTLVVISLAVRTTDWFKYGWARTDICRASSIDEGSNTSSIGQTRVVISLAVRTTDSIKDFWARSGKWKCNWK